MEKLYSTKEIAKMYDVSPYTITQNWCNKGLRFIRGKEGMHFRISWVESFLEEESERQANLRNKKVIAVKCKSFRPRMLPKSINKVSEMLIV